MTTKPNATETDKTNADIPAQKTETKVTVVEEEGKTLITLSEEPQGVVSKLKTALRNRKVLAVAATALTLAAVVVVRNKNSQAVEDEPETTS